MSINSNNPAFKFTARTLTGALYITVCGVSVMVANAIVKPTTPAKKLANVVVASAASGHGISMVTNVLHKAVVKAAAKIAEDA